MIWSKLKTAAQMASALVRKGYLATWYEKDTDGTILHKYKDDSGSIGLIQELSVQPRETVDMVATSAVIPMLEGGRRYVFVQPLTALTIGWVTENAAVRFTADAAGCAINLPPDFTVPAVAAGSTCELRFSGGAVVQTAVSGPAAAPDPFAVPGAERIGPAVPFTEFSVLTGTGGRAAVWTGETVPPSSSLVFADGITSGGISFGIDSLTIPSGVILTGVPSGTTLAGDLRVHTRNSQLYALTQCYRIYLLRTVSLRLKLKTVLTGALPAVRF